MIVRLAVGNEERPRPIVRDAMLTVAGLALLDHVERGVDGLAHRCAADWLEGGRLEVRGSDEFDQSGHASAKRDDGHFHALWNQERPEGVARPGFNRGVAYTTTQPLPPDTAGPTATIDTPVYVRIRV